jgi:hypothetical protein
MDDLSNAAENAFETSRNFIRDLRQGFNDLFGKFLKGEIRSFKDAWRAMLDFMTNALSNALSRKASDWLGSTLSNLFKGSGGSGGSGILGTIGSALGSLFGGLFDGGGGSFNAISGEMAYPNNNFGVQVRHAGGVIGYSPAPMRLAPASLFASAPRLHKGLAADEFPAILQRGETVIPRGGAPAAERPVNVEVRIDNQSGMPLKLEKGPVSQSPDKIIVGIVAKNIQENGALRQLIAGRR